MEEDYWWRHPKNKTVVIFVHGFCGDKRKSWFEFPNLVFGDNELINCDVLSWGYTTRVINLHPKSRLPQIDEITNCLITYLSLKVFNNYESIIFVGHSLGGIVIRQAILTLYQNDEKNNTNDFRKVKLCLFYAVPIHGLKGFIQGVRFIFNRQLRYLVGKKKVLETLKANWNGEIKGTGIRVINIGGGKDKILGESYDIAFNADEIPKWLGYNHVEICKPGNVSDNRYLILRDAILAMNLNKLNKSVAKLIFFDPDKEKNIWREFEGKYYAWNPTWNYELDTMNYGKVLLEAHRDRFANQNLEEVHYIISPQGVNSKLQCSRKIVEDYFRQLQSVIGIEKYKLGYKKYIFYFLNKNCHVSSLDIGTSIFIGEKKGNKNLILFINSQPFMKNNGLHQEAFFTEEKEYVQKHQHFMQEIIYEARKQHKKSPGKQIICKLTETGSLSAEAVENGEHYE